MNFLSSHQSNHPSNHHTIYPTIQPSIHPSIQTFLPPAIYLSFRLNAQELAIENSLLHDQMHQTETDTIDVVTYLKKADQKKDTKVSLI